MAASSQSTFPWDQICTATKGSLHVEDASCCDDTVVVDEPPSLRKIQEAFAQFVHQMRAWADQEGKKEAAVIPVDTGVKVEEVDGNPRVTFKITMLPRSHEEAVSLSTRVGLRIYEAGVLNCLTQAERFVEALRKAFSEGEIRAADPGQFNMKVANLVYKEYGGIASQPRLLLQPQGRAYSLGIYAPEFRDDEMAKLIEILVSSGLPIIRLDLSSCEEIHGNCLEALAGADGIGFLRLADCGKLRVSCLLKQLKTCKVSVVELEGGGREYLRLAKEKLGPDYVLGVKYADGGLYSNYQTKLSAFTQDMKERLKAATLASESERGGIVEAVCKKHGATLVASSRLSLEPLAKACPHLLSMLHQFLPHLHDLDLGGLAELRDKDLEELARRGLQLDSMSLRGSPELTHEGVVALVKGMPSLKRISIGSCKNIRFRHLKRALDKLQDEGKSMRLEVRCDSDVWKSKEPFLSLP